MGSQEHRAGGAGRLDELADLASHRSSDTLASILAAAREQLGMDVALVSEFTEDGRQVFRSFEGDAGSFSLHEGASIPLETSPCRRMVAGRIPNVIPDAKNDGRVNDLGAVQGADIGSYVGLPLRFSDGRLYGTFCCLSHSPDPSLQERDARFMRVLARLAAEQLEREELESRSRRLETRATGVGALLAALEARDGYTGEHSEAVVELSVAVARQMGLSEEEIIDVEQAALLHDVGKMGVPDSVLRKPGPLDEGEWELMRRHPVVGEGIVESIEPLAHLSPVIRAEHERWDGRGYPDGLSGEEIPLISRVVFACDAFHAMTSDRPYRNAMGTSEALGELERNAGTQFCPRTIPTLLEVVGRLAG